MPLCSKYFFQNLNIPKADKTCTGLKRFEAPALQLRRYLVTARMITLRGGRHYGLSLSVPCIIFPALLPRFVQYSSLPDPSRRSVVSQTSVADIRRWAQLLYHFPRFHRATTFVPEPLPRLVGPIFEVATPPSMAASCHWLMGLLPMMLW